MFKRLLLLLALVAAPAMAQYPTLIPECQSPLPWTCPAENYTCSVSLQLKVCRGNVWYDFQTVAAADASANYNWTGFHTWDGGPKHVIYRTGETNGFYFDADDTSWPGVKQIKLPVSDGSSGTRWLIYSTTGPQNLTQNGVITVNGVGDLFSYEASGTNLSWNIPTVTTCTTDGNGGKLTVNAGGQIICAADLGGGGGGVQEGDSPNWTGVHSWNAELNSQNIRFYDAAGPSGEYVYFDVVNITDNMNIRIPAFGNVARTYLAGWVNNPDNSSGGGAYQADQVVSINGNGQLLGKETTDSVPMTWAIGASNECSNDSRGGKLTMDAAGQIICSQDAYGALDLAGDYIWTGTHSFLAGSNFVLRNSDNSGGLQYDLESMTSTGTLKYFDFSGTVWDAVWGTDVDVLNVDMGAVYYDANGQLQALNDGDTPTPTQITWGLSTAATCAGMSNDGKLTINDSGQIVCASDVANTGADPLLNAVRSPQGHTTWNMDDGANHWDLILQAPGQLGAQTLLTLQRTGIGSAILENGLLIDSLDPDTPAALKRGVHIRSTGGSGSTDEAIVIDSGVNKGIVFGTLNTGLFVHDGQTITDFGGTAGVVVTGTTGTNVCAEWDASGNLVPAVSNQPCGSGGGGGDGLWTDNAGNTYSDPITQSVSIGNIASLGSKLSVQNDAAGEYVIAARAAVGQTADLQQWQNSSATAVAKINSEGTLISSDKVALFDKSNFWRLYDNDSVTAAEDCSTMPTDTLTIIESMSIPADTWKFCDGTTEFLSANQGVVTVPTVQLTAAGACINADATASGRLYHDVDCNGTRDDPTDQFIDQTGGGAGDVYYQTIVNPSDADMAQQDKLKFTGTGVTGVDDDAANNRTVVTITDNDTTCDNGGGAGTCDLTSGTTVGGQNICLADGTNCPAEPTPPLRSVAWNAAGMSSNGTGCADPAEFTVGGGWKTWGIKCVDGSSSNFYFNAPYPEDWNGANPLMSFSAINDNADPDGTLDFNVACLCANDGVSFSTNELGAWVGMSIDFTNHDQGAQGWSTQATVQMGLTCPTDGTTEGTIYCVATETAGTTNQHADINITAVKFSYQER